MVTFKKYLLGIHYMSVFLLGNYARYCGFCYFYILNVFFIQTFSNHILLIMLLQLSQFSPFALLPPSTTPLPQAIPTLLSVSIGHVYIFFAYSFPYAVLDIPMTIL